MGLGHDRVLWNQLDGLDQYDAFILPAGFSYGDRIRPGVVAAHSPMMQALKQAAQRGKPILGIGNGCQILIEAGLLPGVSPGVLAGATTLNVRKQAQDIIGVGLHHSKVYLKHVAPERRTVFTAGVDTSTIIAGRVADSAGNFIFSEELTLELEHNQQILFKYCTEQGVVLNDFPTNPNGSMWGIAGLCDPAGNVVGYIPELERDEQGTMLMAGLQRSLTQSSVSKTQPLRWQPGTVTIKPYHPSVESLDIYVSSLQSQYSARMAEMMLQRYGFQVQVRCQQYWEIWHDVEKSQLEQFTKMLVHSGMLLDSSIDQYHFEKTVTPNTMNILVRNINDYEGKYVAEQLRHTYSVMGIGNIMKGTIWELSFPTASATERMNLAGQILQTYILYNPYAQECMVM